MNIEKRFVEENLNRLFSGEHAKGEQNNEKIRAAKLEGYVTQFLMLRSDPERSRFITIYTQRFATLKMKNLQFIHFYMANLGKRSN